MGFLFKLFGGLVGCCFVWGVFFFFFFNQNHRGYEEQEQVLVNVLNRGVIPFYLYVEKQYRAFIVWYTTKAAAVANNSRIHTET